MAHRNFTPERLAGPYASHKLIVQRKNIAGEFILTTVDPFPNVSTPIPFRALFGLAVACLSWMRVLSVVSHAHGSVQEKGKCVLESTRTTVTLSITKNNAVNN